MSPPSDVCPVYLVMEERNRLLLFITPVGPADQPDQKQYDYGQYARHKELHQAGIVTGN